MAAERSTSTAGGFLFGRRFVVDIRLFLLSLVVAMCASFFAGVTKGPNNGHAMNLDLDAFTALMNKMKAELPIPPLNLSPKVIKESLKHSPSGQHLLVDIANVEAEFLNSEERLVQAMTSTVKETALTMLSYHCHELDPMGISCVGVLTESHISFHTWPEEGVITLDLFTCGPHPLLPHAVEIIERHFGIPRENSDEAVRVKWSHELRGFRPDSDKNITAMVDEYSDLSFMVLSPLDMYSKTQVYSNMTKYHRVDIWDVVELDDTPTYEDGIKHGLEGGDPRWDTPELATPDRALFLNGYLIRTSNKDIESHEALVHPAMFAHPNPQHVTIIGGYGGGVIREVLKHNTLQSATLIEHDEELFSIAKKYFPVMHNCSNLIGRADDCFEDELVTVLHDDPKEYFKSNFSGSNPTKQLIDVIIIDDKDPRHDPEFFDDQEFVSSLAEALSPEGVLLINAGLAPDIDDPRADMGVYCVREKLMNLLESHPNIEALLVYEEARSGFNDPTAMILACRSVDCRSRWYARSDQTDFAIFERIVRTHSKEPGISYYDGTTQFSYSIPPKAWETVYCRREPTPFECQYLYLDPTKPLHDLDIDDATKSSFRIEESKANDDGEVQSSVFATVDIPKGSYIMPNHLANSLVLTERNLQGLKTNIEIGGDSVEVLEDLLEFVQEHGHASNTDGTKAHFVEVGGSVLMGRVDSPEEANVGRWVPPHPLGHTPVYSPVYERHRMSFDVFLVATKDIPAGTEVVRYKGLWDRTNARQ